MFTFPSDTVIAATTNKGKVKEFSHKFAALGIQVRSLADYPDIPPIIEDGDTFMANAEIKARTVARALGLPALADDSGLCVDRLGGQPGVYSARYAGEGASDARNVEKLLNMLGADRHATGEAGAAAAEDQAPSAADMRTLPDGVRILSSAQFVCALALAHPQTDDVVRAEGRCSGYIIDRPRGSGGFGYDPVFYVPALGRTMAELTVEEKQSISHRGEALAHMLSQWQF